jgi:hypothetical protein
MTRLPRVLALLLLIAPAPVLAQTPVAGPPSPAPAAAPPPAAPLRIERIVSTFILAPDYRMADLDGALAHLAGGYAGWLTDDTFFVGGAVYTVANRSDDFALTYGGVLIGWTLPAHRRVQLAAQALAGFGRATLGTDLARPALLPFARPVRFGSRTSAGSLRVLVRDDIVVVEPQITVIGKLTDDIAVTVGGGYRAAGLTDGLEDRLNGWSGSVAIRFGLR